MEPTLIEAFDLRLRLRRQHGDTYSADLIVRLPGGIDDRELAQGRPVALDMTALNARRPDPNAYGAALTSQLFADPILDRAWTTACSLAEAAKRPLRVHLDLDPQQVELQTIIWESLQLPHTDLPLARSERILLARYLGTPDLTPLPAAATLSPQAVVVVANPSDREAYSLLPIDVDGEVARARAALTSVPLTVLAAGHGMQPTLANICAALRAGPSLLYLVAHGKLLDDAVLYLEDDQGTTAPVSGTELIAALLQLADRPPLIVLNACHSGGDGVNVLTALAPRLVVAGFPAVIGAQGELPMSLVAAIMPTFLAEVQRDGQADRALAAARAARGNAPDWWRLALWTHRRDGRIWNVAAPPPTQLQRVQHGPEAAITCSHVAATFLWVETFANPARSRTAAPLLDLRNAEAIAAAFDALPVPAGVELADGTRLSRPWPKLHGQNFWRTYLEQRALGSITGHDAYKQLIPIQVTLPWAIDVAGFEGSATLEGYVYPHGVACVITLRSTAMMPVAELTALAPMLRRAQVLELQLNGDTRMYTLNELAEHTLAQLTELRTGKATARGRGAALEPFSIVTIMRGQGANATLPPEAGGPVHTLLETLTRWHIPPVESVLTPLSKARIPTGTPDRQAGDVLYGHARSRAVWFPRRFSTTQPAAALGCYHRNLVFSALQLESLGGLIVNAARQLEDSGQLGGLQRSLAQRAYGILSRMHSGGKHSTYRTMSSRRHLADNDVLPALNRVRAAFDQAALPEDREY